MTRAASLNPPRSKEFPAPVYAETVLAALLEIHAAHTLMLARQKILRRQDAEVCLRAIQRLDRSSISKAKYDGRFEDLFFYIEDHLDSYTEKLRFPTSARRN